MILGIGKELFFLFEWLVLSSNSGALKLDHQVIEILVRILGSESQYSIAAKLLDKIPLQDYMLDVRAYTTILHAYSRTGKYEKAIDLFERMKEMGPSPTLATYNVILDVFGKMGRSWRKILGVLEETRSKGLKFDEFMIKNQSEVLQRSTQKRVFHCDLASERFMKVIGN